MRQERARRARSVLVLVAIFTVLLALLPAGAVAKHDKGPKPPKVDFFLTILHNNDGESQVVNAGSGLEDFGGAARFKTVVDDLKREATHGAWPRRGAKRGVVMVSSGDNFLAGPEFTASLANGVPFYDTIAMELIGYDAVNLGNHDFDFGPEVLADFIAGYIDPPPYVSANLDFSGEVSLQAYVDAGVIVPATVVKERGELIGIIGLETPNLPFISSPRNVEVSDDLIGIVQDQVDMLGARGVDKIILTSHLQDIDNELELACDVQGLDVIVAGGGDELLANPGDLLLPSDAVDELPDNNDNGEFDPGIDGDGIPDAVYGAYPQVADCGGYTVPVVTTSGEYRYVGALVVGFDKDGNLVSIDEGRSGPVRVATGTCNDTMPCDDAVEPDPTMQTTVVDPVEAAVALLGETVIGTSEVDLDGLRSSVRSMETNEGNLVADAFRWQVTEWAPDPTMVPDVAISNGGGIRNNTIISAGDITVLDTFDILPFSNILTLVPSIPRSQFKEIIENTVGCTQPDDSTTNINCGSGRFAQISGFSFSWSASGVAQIVDGDGNVTTAGTRVQTVTLDDGTPIVIGGTVQSGDPINIAIVDFLANGGDQYPFRGAAFTNTGVAYQKALENYIVDGLGGLIAAVDYPEGGEGRITALP